MPDAPDQAAVTAEQAALSEKERRERLRASVEEIVGRLNLGAAAMQWAEMIPYDMLRASHKKCDTCGLWDKGEAAREATVWLHSEWLRGQTYAYLASGIAALVPGAPSESAIQRHFCGDNTTGRKARPEHIGVKAALQRQRAERWMSDAIARASDEAARLPGQFSRVGELVLEQAGDALETGRITYEKPIDVKIAVQIAMVLGAGRDRTGGSIGALAQLGRMIAAIRSEGGDEMVARITAAMSPAPPLPALPAPSTFLEPTQGERADEDGVQRRRRSAGDDDEDEE